MLLAFSVFAQARHGQLDVDPKRRQFGVQFVHLGTVGGCVTAPRKRRSGCTEQMANGSVGGDHERLDHLRCLVGPFDLNPQFILSLKARSQFRVVEIESDFTGLPCGGQRQHPVVGIRGQHIVVGDVGRDLNDGFVGLRVHDGVVTVQRHGDHHRQAVHIGS